MSKLYACIISNRAKTDKEELLSIAHQFSYAIEMLDDGVLFDVSGLERLIGKPDVISRQILEQLQRQNIPGNIAVAENTDSALLLARQNKGISHTVASVSEFHQLPLQNLEIGTDAIRIFDELGIKTVKELQQIPDDDLINRYGQDFRKVIDIIKQNGRRFLTPNIKDSNVVWEYNLDFPVEDFEQLIFIVNHGLDNLFASIAHEALSTEHLDIHFRLANKTVREYEIKTSFPTLEKSFWLKLINLRISLDPPEAAMLGVKVTAHFTRQRPDQKGLYAVTRPAPESLLLTVNKLKKLVGEENVGVPVLLDQRLSEAFTLDADSMPEVRTGSGSDWVPVLANDHISRDRGIIAFTYFHPPLRAEVLVRDGRLVFLKTRHFSGHVTEYSGVWKANSKWWATAWKTQEWDVEVEDHGVYRLCKVNKEWFLAGEYD